MPRPPSLLAFLSPSACSPGYNDHGGRGGPGLDCWKSAFFAAFSPVAVGRPGFSDAYTDQGRLDDTWAFDLAVRDQASSAQTPTKTVVVDFCSKLPRTVCLIFLQKACMSMTTACRHDRC